MNRTSLKHFAIATLLSAGSTSICWSAPLEIGALNFPPYYVVENGATVAGGEFVDYLKKLFAKAGIDYVFKGYPARRLYANVADGTTQIWMGTLGVPEYEGKTLISPQKITDINLEVYGSGPVDALPKTINDLKGKSVATIRGYTYGGLLAKLEDPQNSIKLSAVTEHKAAFQMLQAGRVDYVLDYIEPATETLNTLTVPGINKRSWMVLGIYIHVSKMTPDAQTVMNKLMKAHDELKTDGKKKM